MGTVVLCLAAFLVFALNFSSSSVGAPVASESVPYLLGLGIADITGPVVETNMMGYASLPQTGTGLHMRERSRAFIVADASGPSNCIVFINADIAMGDTGVRRSIVSELSTMYSGLYTNDNIAFVGTHQHSGVGGYPENLLPQVTSFGYVKQTADAIVTGSVLAVQRAHNSLAPGTLHLGNTTILGANRNRSPSAYLANPQEERAMYRYDQDKDMTLLRFNDVNGNARGFLSFFAVHGTSLYENNTLISGDNKGMAAYMYESFNQMRCRAKLLSSLASRKLMWGTRVRILSGHSAKAPVNLTTACPVISITPPAGGPWKTAMGGFRTSDFESNRIIAEHQFHGAQTIMGQQLAPVEGTVKSVHVYMKMDFHNFTLPNGTLVQTCPAAMGFSFAGGTTDGPGTFDFVQGDNSSQPQNSFWELVKDAVTPDPDAQQIACQDPKPILLNTGYATTPYLWTPHTVDIQLLRVGNFVMLIIPGELTTMAGRRLRNAIRARLISEGVLGSNAYVVVAGPANTYSHYIATKEEYSVQRYEGASTIYGQYTLDAYIDKYSHLVSYLADNATGTPASDPPPPEQTSMAISLQTPVLFDAPPIGYNFGQTLVDVDSTPYGVGETVFALFVGANPRNNLRLDGTFLTIDRAVSGTWVTVRSDSHPSTIYQWTRTSTVLGTSTVNISWTIEDGTLAGTYRIRYFGDSKSISGAISPFTGTPSNFTVS